MRDMSTDVLVVGSGAGAVACIPELARRGARVLVAERGIRDDEKLGTVVDRGKRIYQEQGAFPKSVEGVPYYRRIGVGGTIDVSCANGVSPPASYLHRHQLDLQGELDEVRSELGITPVPATHIGTNSKLLAEAAARLGYDMSPMPKFIDFGRCKNCALCELRCSAGAVWSAERNLAALSQVESVQVLEGTTVTHLIRENGVAVAAVGVSRGEPVRIRAGAFVLAAGGLGTPVILQRSGIDAGKYLHLDLYTVVYGQSPRFAIGRELPMPAVYTHPDESFVIAPYLDLDLWHAMHTKKIARWLHKGNIYGLMVKIADSSEGAVDADGTVHKRLTPLDEERLRQGGAIARRVLLESGADPSTLVEASARGAHPGGTAAYGEVLDEELRVRGTRNVYVADAAAMPEALGKPPIVTIMALAKKAAKSVIAARP
jgi:choline dehydrogenase-like flavoprotein